jgi:hypothetical protein
MTAIKLSIREWLVVTNSDVAVHQVGVRFTANSGPYRVYMPFEKSISVACDQLVSIPSEILAIFVEN